MECFGLVITLHACSSTLSTTLISKRRANICKKYVCYVSAVYLFESFRGISHFQKHRNNSDHDKRNGTYFFFLLKLSNPVLTLSEIVALLLTLISIWFFQAERSRAIYLHSFVRGVISRNILPRQPLAWSPNNVEC